MSQKSSKVWWTQPIEDFWQDGKSFLERNNCEVILGRRGSEGGPPFSEDQIIMGGKDVNALIVAGRETITSKIIENLNQLRIVITAGVGVDKIDIASATKKGVLVANSPVPADYAGVAEGSVARLLSLAKKLSYCDKETREGRWTSNHENLKTVFLGKDVTVGLLGFGRVGSYVARLLRPWGLRIIAYDPYVTQERAFLMGVELVDLETLLRESDFLSIHVVLTSETRHMLREEELGKMKKGAYIINTSRGAVIDQTALCKALRENWIAGAALDVFETEPVEGDILSPDLANKLLLSPHTSGMSNDMERDIVMSMVQSCVQALNGIVPKTVVNRDAIPKWRETVSPELLKAASR